MIVFKNWNMQHLSMILKVCCVPRWHMPILRTGLLYPDSVMLRHDLLLNETHWRYVTLRLSFHVIILKKTKKTNKTLNA